MHYLKRRLNIRFSLFLAVTHVTFFGLPMFNNQGTYQKVLGVSISRLLQGRKNEIIFFHFCLALKNNRNKINISLTALHAVSPVSKLSI